MDRSDRRSTVLGRRPLLATTGLALASATAGCLGFFDDDDPGDSLIGQIGSGRRGRGDPGGTPMAEMPDLEGFLSVYSGRGRFLVGPLVDYIDDLYEDLTLDVRYGGSTDLVNQILNEGSGSPADVFYSVNAGALGVLADEGRTQPLPSDLLDLVRDEFHTDDWIGTSGRARTVPYNDDRFDEDAIPSTVMAFPEAFDGDLGWAPTYGSCQAFVTAMRILEGDSATRAWLEGVRDAGIRDYPDEFT
ncbi:MAG: iron ABC transporter substrate-binding protein, partial [Halobacteriota archaeon]